MNSHLKLLQPYPFEKLQQLKQGVNPPADLSPVALSIGEPRHPAPEFVAEALTADLHTLCNYPVTRGLDALREAIAAWASRRYRLGDGALDPARQVVPVNGTREALFAIAQAVVDRAGEPLVMMPNPFYQIYEGAALLAGAQPYFMNCTADHAYLPDLDAVSDTDWRRCQLIYVCSPGNPTGAVADLDFFQRLLELADRHDFVIASDECYSELYPDEERPPLGLLEACARLGRDDYRRCLVFNSLSKRSNLPGLRSGFVAGDADIIAPFLHFRTYHGCAMPLFAQRASIAAWGDEQHVLANRELYREKFRRVLEILAPVMEVAAPDAGFYLWPRTPGDDATFARTLYAQQNVTVLPGSYLSRDSNGINPGSDHVRIALVAPLAECVDAAQRIRHCIESL